VSAHTRVYYVPYSSYDSYANKVGMFFSGGLGRCSLDHLDLEVYCDEIGMVRYLERYISNVHFDKFDNFL